jgi:mannosyltransferase OCH1-like enzyme
MINIYQCYHNKKYIPNKVYENIKKYASKYKHIIYNDDECLEYIKNNYDDKVLETYNKLENKAHKADLWRYCILYKEGGLYMDIKVELIKDINNLFDPNILTTIFRKKNIFNGLISTPKNNPLLLELINYMIDNRYEKITYQMFCKNFANTIRKYTNKPLSNSLFIVENIPNIYLFEERVIKYKDGDDRNLFDRYKLIDKIYDKDINIINTRFLDYTGKVNSW